MATSWFSRTGSVATEPTDYTKLPGLPTCASGSDQICAIFATVDSGNVPLIDNTMLIEMVQALDDRNDTTNVKLRA